MIRPHHGPTARKNSAEFQSLADGIRQVLIVAAALFFVACQTKALHLTPAQQTVAGQLKTIDPWKDGASLPAKTSIIDVHTHSFNARYLPLRGILLGKRDAFPPVTTLISDDCARVIAQALVDRTELADTPRQQGIGRTADTQELRSKSHPGPVCLVFLHLIDKAIKAGCWAPDKSFKERLRIVDNMAANMNPLEKLAVQAAASMMGMDEHTGGGKTSEDTLSGTQAALRFLWTATQNDAGMTKLYRDMHAGVPMKGRITMVSHMMDLGPVYDQPAEGKVLLDFPQQVKRMEQYQSQSGSGLFYFVAYNPYRDHPANGKSSRALDLVRDAITNHGAKGVKVYPPSGYRPAGNEIKRRPFALFTRYPGQQWDARYGKLGPDKNKALDSELNELLEWCIKHDVPVFAHSGYGEFEARKKYGLYHANPYYWQKFLEAHSTPGNPCRLRLCLGHAGGGDFWFGSGSHADWGERAYYLSTHYPNVYCEITTGDPIMRPDSQAYFVDQLARLFVRSALDARDSKGTEILYPFASKLMYGTDWYLPDKGKPNAVLLATQKAFLHPSLRDYYADYFSGNARRYLKLRGD